MTMTLISRSYEALLAATVLRAILPSMMVEARLAEIADSYVEHHRLRAAAELDHFRGLQDEEAVSTAALARPPNGKRHPHQYRISRVALEESRRRLIHNLRLLKRTKSFHELFGLVEQLSGSISGSGPLTVYDTALRSAPRFSLEP